MKIELDDVSPSEAVEVELALHERAMELREANQPEIAYKLRELAKSVDRQTRTE